MYQDAEYKISPRNILYAYERTREPTPEAGLVRSRIQRVTSTQERTESGNQRKRCKDSGGIKDTPQWVELGYEASGNLSDANVLFLRA